MQYNYEGMNDNIYLNTKKKMQYSGYNRLQLVEKRVNMHGRLNK